MARSNSSGWRLLRPSYYLRRPRRLILLFASLLCFSLLIWDRRSLIQDHEIERAELENQKQQLSSQIETLRKMLKDYPKKDVQVSDDTKSSFMSKDTDLQDFSNDAQSEERRLKIKEAMLHAWRSYEKYAWGHDELQPLSKNGVDDFGGLGATIVDSLDTLYIMGLHDEFAKARDWVASSLDFNKNYDASVFETTIRVVGGLLSAYDLSGEKMFLEKVQQLADKLLPAWNSPSGIPYGSINLAYGNPRSPGWTGGSSVLADLATEQVEFIALSHRTGDPRYKEKVENVIKQIKKIFPKDGLVPIYISPESGEATTSKITFGAMGDSFYEYLLKVWILGNKTEAVREYREMWEQSMDGLMTLIKKSTPSSFSYIAERVGQNSYIDKMDELACFAPGMLVLGADGKDAEMNKKYLDLAKELGRTCYNFYNSTPTKLAGENYEFRTGQDMQVGVAWNILRPETVESLMYLWRKTGDAKYRDWGWDIFQAFESQSRTDSGYVGLRDVRSGEKDNKMQSFFLAETFKYLYLLFSPSNVIPLDQWVFNTEAHPIRITPMLSTEVKNNTGNFDARNRILDRLRHRKKLIGA